MFVFESVAGNDDEEEPLLNFIFVDYEVWYWYGKFEADLT